MIFPSRRSSLLSIAFEAAQRLMNRSNAGRRTSVSLLKTWTQLRGASFSMKDAELATHLCLDNRSGDKSERNITLILNENLWVEFSKAECCRIKDVCAISWILAMTCTLSDQGIWNELSNDKIATKSFHKTSSRTFCTWRRLWFPLAGACTVWIGQVRTGWVDATSLVRTSFAQSVGSKN